MLSAISSLGILEFFDNTDDKSPHIVPDDVYHSLSESIDQVFRRSTMTVATGETEEMMEHVAMPLYVSEPKSSSDPAVQPIKQPMGKPKKLHRKWNAPYHRDSDGDLSSLNFSSEDQRGEKESSSFSIVSLSNAGEEVPELRSTTAKMAISSSGVLSTMWKRINEASGMSTCLTHETLFLPLSSLKDSLIKKNVAASVASEICSVVERKLLGRELSTFSTSGNFFFIAHSFSFRHPNCHHKGRHFFCNSANPNPIRRWQAF